MADPRIGLMGEAGKCCFAVGGGSLGMIPEFLKTKEIVHTDITELIVTENMHDRKVIMYERSDGLLIIPGGFGTMDEFFEITTWGQLGLHSKPIGILKYEWIIIRFIISNLIEWCQGLFNKVQSQRTVIVSEDVEDIIRKNGRFQTFTKANIG